MSEFGLLRRLAPAWATWLGDVPGATVWILAPLLPSGARVAAFVIRITNEDGYLDAAEREPGSRLPRWCPQLHLNPDSTFCLGRRAFASDGDSDVAAFWQALGEFLVAQHHIERRGRWPVGRWLSHGPYAAEQQVKAEAAAAAIGFEAEYAECLEMDEGWFAMQARSGARRVARDETCPRNCRDARGRPILFARCRHQRGLQRVVAAERERRTAHDRFFNTARLDGMTCCERVEGCPLSRSAAA